MTVDLTLVEGIPKHLLPSNLVSIKLIKGGLNNRNLLLNSHQLLKIYLQRDEKNDPVRLRYLREKDALFALDKCTFAPRLLNSEEKNKKYYIKRQWVDGSTVTLNNLKKQPERIMIPLSSLHKCTYTSEGDYNYFDVIERYIKEYKLYYDLSAQKEVFFPQPEAIKSLYYNKRQIIRTFTQHKLSTRIHGDLVFSNIITPPKGDQSIFIDWEYATSGNPLIDLAYLFSQNNIPKESQRDCIVAYEEYSSIEIDLHLLEEYCILMNLMSALWYALQALRLDSIKGQELVPPVSNSDFRKMAQKAFLMLSLHQ